MFLANIEDKSAPVFGYAQKEAELDFGYINQRLVDSSYLCGDDFTAADIMMCTVLGFAQMQEMLGGYPHIQSYLTRIQKRPAFIKAASFG